MRQRIEILVFPDLKESSDYFVLDHYHTVIKAHYFAYSNLDGSCRCLAIYGSIAEGHFKRIAI